MTDIFTASGTRGSYIYLGLLFCVVAAVGWLFWLRQPSLNQQYRERGFEMTWVAFREAVRFAHYKFLSANLQVEDKNAVFHDVWQSGSEGLDYNGFGFPVALDADREKPWFPLSPEGCEAIWQFLLGRSFHLSTEKLESGNNSERLLVSVSQDLACHYQPGWSKDMAILYYPADGSVIFFDKRRTN